MLTQGEPRSFGRLARARDGAVRAVDGWPLWLLALIGLTICFVFYGGFPMSAHRVLGLISQSPLDPPTLLNGRPITSGDAYQYSSPLGPLLAWAAGARGDGRYVLFSAAVITSFVAIAACLAASTIERERLMRWVTYLFVASLFVPRVEVRNGIVTVSRFWSILAGHYLPAAT